MIVFVVLWAVVEAVAIIQRSSLLCNAGLY
jgi:hypothetical protein